MRLPPLPFRIALLLVLALGWIQQSDAAPPLVPSPNAKFAPVPAGPPDRFQPDPNIGPADPTDSLSGVAFLSSAKARRLGLRPDKLPPGPGIPGPQPQTLSDGSQYTLQVTNDAQQDTEPTDRTLTIGSTTYTTVASIKYLFTGPAPNQNRFRNYFATTTDFSTWTRGELPMPTGYTQSGDPLMDENSYTTGIAPLRKYVTGIIFQDYTGPTVVPNAIGVWHSDDGGMTWSQPTLAAVNTDQNFFLDKPAINVSQWSGNNGTVFIAYMLVDLRPSNPSQLLVARSTDGGVTFSQPVLVTSGNIEGPQILTSPYGDKVYVLWADYTLNAIRMSTSTSSLLVWTAGETAATGSLVTPSTQYLNGGSGVRALTLPMARYNWVKNCVSVVWHEFESSSSNQTDIFYVAKTASGWQTKKRISPTTNDQFMPGFDFDSLGRFMVTFYDRSQDPNNLLYRESWARTDYFGNVLSSGVLAVPDSNPCYAANPCQKPFIGDYQDSWWWNFSDQYGNRFNAVWTQQTSNTTGNIYVTGIQ